MGELLDMANGWLTLAFGIENEKLKKSTKQKSKEVHSCLFLLWFSVAVIFDLLPLIVRMLIAPSINFYRLC